MSEVDFIVIGSGPAGVSAALPLVDAGRKVLMLDGADAVERPERSAAERMLGPSLEGLSVEDGLSPKLRAPEARRAIAAFLRAYAIEADNFVAIGALARGGLSRLWGAFAAEFDPAELERWPISARELAPFYARVTARIGISGSVGDAAGVRLGGSGPLLPPLPLGKASQILLSRYTYEKESDFALGHARNAVLSQAWEGRAACDLRNQCLWGCGSGAIYDARQDLARLARNDNFHSVDGAVVVALEDENGQWRVRCADGRSLLSSRVLLAAGTLGSTALAAPLLGPLDDWPLLSNPVVASPLLVPAALWGRPKPSHSLAQLSYFLRFDGTEAAGAVYETTGLPASGFVNQLPLGRRAGEAAFRFLSPGLLVAATSFPGSLSRNRLHFDSSTGRLSIRGGFAQNLPQIAKGTLRRLATQWRKLGAFLLPGGRLASPGTDAHFAGTLPMGGGGRNGTSVLGEVTGRTGLHVVDGSILPSLSARHATLTIMANAMRIGEALAKV